RRARRRRQFLHDSLQRHGISVHERSVWLRQSGHAHRHADRERPVSGRAYFQRRPRPRTSDGMAQEKTEYHHHVKSLHRVFTTKLFMSLRSPTKHENGVVLQSLFSDESVIPPCFYQESRDRNWTPD